MKDSLWKKEILDYYQKAKEEAESDDYDFIYIGEAKLEAIKFVLDKSGIKINGITQ